MNESFLQFTTYCVNILLIIENPKLLTKKKKKTLTSDLF